MLTPNKRVRATIARTALEILAGLDDGEKLHKDTLWTLVEQRYTDLAEDWAAHVSKGEPRTSLVWGSSELAAIGWLAKDGWGNWQATGAGRWSLTEYPDLETWSAAVDQRYQGWNRNRPRFEQAEKLLSLLPEGSWVAADTLAGQLGVSEELLVQRFYRMRPEGWHRLLNGEGTIPKEARLTPNERAEAEKLLVESGTAGPDGRAPSHQRLDRADLAQYLDAGDTSDSDEAKRRAWLVRGSNVQGENLVRSLWLPRGVCSLAASRLRELPAGSNREDVQAAVAEDYAHLSAAERSRLAVEYHAFLTRMRTGDIVLTNDGSAVYIGVVDGPAGFTASSGNRANLQRAVSWRNPHSPLDYADALPADAANRIANPDTTVVDLTEFVGDLEKLLGEEPEQPVTSRPFTLPDATEALAAELHLPAEWLQECVELLRDRPQLVFYGPPGTGKTYVAQALAKHLTGGKPENTQLVQFHPAYSYEDFFEGYRPRPGGDGQAGGFELVPGPLRTLADAARKHPDEPFVLVIDEINRGNLAKVFGELYFLLEYRDRSVNLLYGSDGGLGFTLPKNLVLLATMNTADRSIALIDAAMRRRFWFRELHPSAEPAAGVLERWIAARVSAGLPVHGDAARLLAALNERIEDRDFRVGPAYLMRAAVHEHPRGLERVWEHQLLPLLEEHHYGDDTDVAGRYGLAALRKQLAGDED